MPKIPREEEKDPTSTVNFCQRCDLLLRSQGNASDAIETRSRSLAPFFKSWWQLLGDDACESSMAGLLAADSGWSGHPCPAAEQNRQETQVDLRLQVYHCNRSAFCIPALVVWETDDSVFACKESPFWQTLSWLQLTKEFKLSSWLKGYNAGSFSCSEGGSLPKTHRDSRNSSRGWDDFSHPSWFVYQRRHSAV